jgi:Ca2+-binding RTX toxin-like protein
MSRFELYSNSARNLVIQATRASTEDDFFLLALPFVPLLPQDGFIDDPETGESYLSRTFRVDGTPTPIYASSLPLGADPRYFTVAYGAGELHARYYFYDMGDERHFFAVSMLDADLSPFADLVANDAGEDLFVLNRVTGVLRNETGQEATYGEVDLWTFLLGGDDDLHGSAGNDQIDAGNGNDVLLGQGGNDTLSGGAGADFIYGGSGNDVVDGGAGLEDLLDFRGGFGLFDNGAAGPVRITLTGSTGATAFINGIAEDTVRNVERIQGGDFNDRLVGDSKDNVFLGVSGDDRLFGGAGNDLLLGGSGNDQLDGGAGIDLVDFSSISLGATFIGIGPTVGNIAVTLAGATLATVFVDGIAADTLVNVENLIGAGGNDTLRGDAAANQLAGGGNGDDTLQGAGGNDILIAEQDRFVGPGSDLLDGGAGIDTVTWAIPDSTLGFLFPRDPFDRGIQVTLNGGTAAPMIQGTTTIGTLVRVENLVGGEGNDTFIGDSLVNQLEGRGGEDTLDGREGDDTLAGGTGNDLLTGGGGNDLADYSQALRPNGVVGRTGIEITLNGSVAATVFVGSGAERDSLAGIENIRGSRGDDRMVGDQLANTLLGIGGNDFLVGGVGVDVLDGGTGFDTASFEDQTAAVVITLTGTAAQARIGGVLQDTLRSIENLIGGTGNDTFVGDGNRNRFLGGSGADTFSGEGGNDSFVGGLGKDLIDGGAGVDELDYSAGADKIRVTLSGSAAALVQVGGTTEDTVLNIENVTGGSSSDTLLGDSNANVLTAGRGEDFLDGGLGADTLIGGAQGVGDGVDRFVFSSALGFGNVDVIADFETGTDKIVLDDDIFTRLGGTSLGVALSAANFRIGGGAVDADDYIIFNNAEGSLLYDADGSGAGFGVRVAYIGTVGGAVVTAADFLIVS